MIKVLKVVVCMTYQIILSYKLKLLAINKYYNSIMNNHSKLCCVRMTASTNQGHPFLLYYIFNYAMSIIIKIHEYIIKIQYVLCYMYIIRSSMLRECILYFPQCIASNWIYHQIGMSVVHSYASSLTIHMTLCTKKSLWKQCIVGSIQYFLIYFNHNFVSALFT